MATYVGDLITEVRRDTDNEDTEGISTEDFLRYMNFAQMRLQGLISSRGSTLFRVEKIIPLVGTTSEYSIDDNVYLGESIVDVQYSSSGLEQDYVEIREIAESYRHRHNSSHPRAYTRRAGKILLPPSTNNYVGTLKVVYDRALDRLDLRRGQIDAVTESSLVITADTISLVDANEATRINGVTDGWMCIQSASGDVRAYNIVYASLDTNSPFTFTHIEHTMSEGESISINDYITVGRYTTTHLTTLSSPDVERYLQLYCMVKIFRRDSSSDATEAARELAAVEKALVENFQAVQRDEGNIQIDDPGMLLGSSDQW